MSEGELLRGAAVDEQRATGDSLVGLGEGHRCREGLLVEEFAVLAVEDRVVDEVAGSRGLAGGDHLHERVAIGGP